MYTYCKKYGNRVLLREHTREIRTITKHSWNLFVEDEKGDYRTIYGKPLRKENFSTVKKLTSAIKENDIINLYGAKNCGYQYIRDKFLYKDPITPNDLYIANIDIETGRDSQGYSSVKDARCPITAITMQDISKNIYNVWGYKKEGYTPKKDNIRYINCLSEKDMLIKFVTFFSLRYPDILTGWNCEQYDVPYIINRLRILFDERADALIDALSPFGIVYDKSCRDNFGNFQDIYEIIGISILDYLPLFKKFTYKTPENYKLNTVANMILGEKKIDYSEYSDLQKLYDTNYEKFIDYNIHDVYLVSELDKKLKLFELVLSIAYKSGINYNDVLSPVNTWDVYIYNNIMDKGMVPIIKLPLNDGGEYIGAFVKEPLPGMYKWIVSFDLNSLYPHIQMGINISPEKKISDQNLPQELQDLRGKLGGVQSGIIKLLNEEIDTSVLLKYNVSLSPNGQFYKRDSDGFIPEILEGLYRERKDVKKSMLDDKQKMENDSFLDLSNQIAAKNTLQLALKILMNAEYGAFANLYFRYHDLKNAEAITSTGRLSILWVAKHLNIYLNRILKTKDKDYVIASDTDSVYLNLEYLVDKFIKPKTQDTKKIVDVLDEWSSKILVPEINRIYENLALYTNSYKQKMVMVREVIADKGFWTGKKRYALNVHDSEGVRYTKPKVKIMGLESVRSSIPEFSRLYIQDGIKKILTENEDIVQDFILDVNKKFIVQLPEDISFPRGVNNIEKWRDKNGMPKKGCPIHVRGCIVYNKYLDDCNCADERIQSGDKIKFCYLKLPNIFRSHVIAFPPIINSEVYKEIKTSINYEDQYTGTFFKPINAILDCVGWSAEKINKIDDICIGDFY